MTPCDLFTASMAAELLEDEVRRFSLAEQLPEDLSDEERRRAAAADKTNCFYVVEGEDPEDGATASFQIDRFLFRSVEQFRGTFEESRGAYEESEPVEGLGRAAMIEGRGRGLESVRVGGRGDQLRSGRPRDRGAAPGLLEGRS